MATSTPLTHAERGAMGARKANDNMSGAERRQRASKAHLASAVAAVVNRAPELTPEQAARLAAIFAPAGAV